MIEPRLRAREARGHSRVKGVCYSTSLACVNFYGATNERSADSPSRRAILLRSDPVLTAVTSKS